MLLTTVSGLADQDVAERMRHTARLLHCSPTLVEQAVDEAVAAYRDGATPYAALNAGIELIHQFTQGRVPANPPGGNTPPSPIAGRVPFAWVESWPFLIVAALVVAGLAWLKYSGLLQ